MLLKRKTVSTIKVMFPPCSKIGFKLLSSVTLNSKVPTSPGCVEIFTKSWIGLCVMVNGLTKYTGNMVLHLPKVASDHWHVLVKFSEIEVVSKANKPF